MSNRILNQMLYMILNLIPIQSLNLQSSYFFCLRLQTLIIFFQLIDHAWLSYIMYNKLKIYPGLCPNETFGSDSSSSEKKQKSPNHRPLVDFHSGLIFWNIRMLDDYWNSCSFKMGTRKSRAGKFWIDNNFTCSQ